VIRGQASAATETMRAREALLHASQAEAATLREELADKCGALEGLLEAERCRGAAAEDRAADLEALTRQTTRQA
jgi:hypothetical protein